METNAFGQNCGTYLPNYKTAKIPTNEILNGQYCSLLPICVDNHKKALFEALCLSNNNSSWTYLPYGPFLNSHDFEAWLSKETTSSDPFFYIIKEHNSKKILGLFSLMRIVPLHGVIEIGHVHFSDQLKKSRAATEAIYILLKESFDKLGYRRVEWKCHSLNEASKKAALRLGFSYEGRFRQDRVFKNYNRDTDWFSIIDSEWPALRTRFELWLNINNFDREGRQIKSLRQF